MYIFPQKEEEGASACVAATLAFRFSRLQVGYARLQLPAWTGPPYLSGFCLSVAAVSDPPAFGNCGDLLVLKVRTVFSAGGCRTPALLSGSRLDQIMTRLDYRAIVNGRCKCLRGCANCKRLKFVFYNTNNNNKKQNLFSKICK